MSAEDLTLEKMRVTERLASLEVKIDSLIIANNTALKIINGNGEPKTGLVYRTAILEDDKEKIKL